MSRLFFEVRAKTGKKIQVSETRWKLITEIKHPDVQNREKEVKETLINPDEIRISTQDKAVHLYYKWYGKLAMAVVTKHKNGDGFIITAYRTDRIKEGKSIFPGKK